MFIVKWYMLRLNQRDPDRTIIEYDNVFTMVNTRLFDPGIEPYVLPSQCEQVFYSEVPGKVGWSFVVRHDPRGRPVNFVVRRNPRGRPVKYNLDDGNEEDSLEEEYDDKEHDQLELADDDDPIEDVQGIVESDDVATTTNPGISILF